MEYSTLESTTTELTPEKLAIMKLRSSEADRDTFSETDTNLAGDGLFSSLAGGASGGASGISRTKSSSRALTRSNRQFSSSSRRTGNFMQSHRSKMSMELTTQAEAKVFALIELMSNASREASSLKEYWSKLMTDREGYDREREELLLRIEEVTDTLERTQHQHTDRHRELADRKKEVDRLLVELSAALNGLNEHKRRLAERDHELESTRKEFQDIKVTSIRLRTDYDKIKGDFGGLESKLRVAENERDRVKEDAELHRAQVRDLTRENGDLKGRNSEITVKLEASTKEISTYLERIKSLEREKAGELFERERLEEAVRKITTRAEEATRELVEVNERSTTLSREARRLKEALQLVETERDESAVIIERLRLELKNKTTGLDDAETRYGDIHLKFEQLKRETAVKEDRFSSMETEIASLRRTVETKQEEHRRTLLENDQLRDDLEAERRKHADNQRELSNLQESATRAEAALVEIRAESFHATERIRQIEHERNDANDKLAPLNKEILELKERVGALQVEARTAAEARDRAHKELHEIRRKYEEVTETITEWKDDSGELEYEIESLRTMLYEAREQKERAISARNSADRERDEYVEKYEEKCRELEKLSDSRSSFFHSHSHGHGHSHSHGHSHGHEHGRGKSESRTTSTRFVTTTSTANGGETEVVDNA